MFVSPPLEINDDVVSESREKANLLSNYFKSVFTKEDLQNMPPWSYQPQFWHTTDPLKHGGDNETSSEGGLQKS